MRRALLGTGLLTLGLLAMSPRREPQASPLPRPPSVDAPSDAPPQSTVRLDGLLAPADVEFDEYAVPTIRAASFLDALRLQGYLHARDRFAQMDLMRRFAAGELAEIASSLALTIDRDQRKMRLRAAALSALARLADDEREALEAYTAGVNAGLRSLEAPPPEYGFLKAPLEPWRLEDSLLVGLSMAAMLNDSAREEVARAEIDESLSPDLVAFLRPAISRWDAPLLEDSPDDRRAATVSMPSPSSIDTRVLRNTPPSPATAPSSGSSSDRSSAHARPPFSLARAGASFEDELVGAPLPIGSNGWAVGSPRTKEGRAILVNDMHLQITVPGIWYRMSMAYDEAAPTTAGRDAGAGADPPRVRRLDGVTLPGAPGMVSGSNGFVAWGFTNAEADFIDFVIVEPDPADPNRYLVPGGSEPYGIERESLRALGAAEPETLEVRTTRWGPIVEQDHRQRALALVWAATQPGGLNLGLLPMRKANDVRGALDIARRWRGPQQNVVVADHQGHIGWTISGYLPKRVGFDGAVPTTWSDGQRRWEGERDEGDRPEIVDPPSGMIVTANQRTLPLAAASSFGQAWADPDRAYRIRERIATAGPLDEQGCTSIQLDIRSSRLAAWRDAVLPAVERGARSAESSGERTKQFAALAKILADWNGDATVETKAMGVLRGVRAQLVERVAGALIEADLARRNPGVLADERSRRASHLSRGWVSDEAVLEIISSRPSHLLPPSASTWDDLVQTATLQAASQVRDRNGLRRWGALNASDFAHPLARAIPLLASSYRIEPHEQPGHPTTVRVATPGYGASDRLVVSPGLEDRGLIAIPAGQHARPTSPHYRDLHESWRAGSYLRLRPTQIAERLRCTP